MRRALSYMLPFQESPLISTTTLQENPHPPPWPPPPFYTGRSQDSMRLNISSNPWLVRDRGGAVRWGCKGSLSEFKTQALFSAQHYFILWGEMVDKRQITYLRTFTGKVLFNKSKKQHIFLNSLLRTMPDTVKTNKNVLSPRRTPQSS